jgi:hypothetical protein
MLDHRTGAVFLKLCAKKELQRGEALCGWEIKIHVAPGHAAVWHLQLSEVLDVRVLLQQLTAHAALEEVLVDGTQVHKVMAVSQSKQGNVWI